MSDAPRSDDPSNAQLADLIGGQLPYLRRYARALTGTQDSGDRYAVVTLEAIVGDASTFDAALPPRVALFQVFHRIWASSGAIVETPDAADTEAEQSAQRRLARLTPNAREAVLLRALEGYGADRIAQVLGVDQAEAAELLEIGARELDQGARGRVMIIEDEPIIAMDIQAIVTGLGHSVVGISRTASEAVAMAKAEAPDLVLADIQLADGSSGIDAVRDILAQSADTPVIFITAYPERLLTGERPEPTFLITKPFQETQVATAVNQALSFV